MCSLKLPGKAPSLKWWPKAVRTIPTKPCRTGLQHPRTLRHGAHPQISLTQATPSALLFTRHKQQQVIYQMSKLLVSQRNPPPKSVLEKPTLCPQSQSEPASFPQQQTQLLQHGPAFWQSPTSSCQSPDAKPGRACCEGGCCAPSSGAALLS